MENQNLIYEPIKQVNINNQNAFPLDLHITPKSVFMGLSDYSVSFLSLDTMQLVWNVPAAHSRKISGVCQVQDRLFASCSNDSTIKFYDKNTGHVVSQLKSIIKQKKFEDINQQPFYSVSSSEYIIAAGSEGLIRFYDIRTMQLRSTFEESQNDEITSVHFNPWVSTELLSSSLDGILVLYDLTQLNEEESLTNSLLSYFYHKVIRFEEALDSSDFIDKETCYSVSTTSTIAVIDHARGVKLTEIQTIDHNELHEDYLVGATMYKGQLNYFVGNKEKLSSLRQFNLQTHKTNSLLTNQTDQIRHIKYIDANDRFLLFGEDGSLEVLQSKEELTNSIEQEMQDAFLDETPVQQITKKR